MPCEENKNHDPDRYCERCNTCFECLEEDQEYTLNNLKARIKADLQEILDGIRGEINAHPAHRNIGKKGCMIRIQKVMDKI